MLYATFSVPAIARLFPGVAMFSLMACKLVLHAAGIVLAFATFQSIRHGTTKSSAGENIEIANLFAGLLIFQWSGFMLYRLVEWIVFEYIAG